MTEDSKHRSEHDFDALSKLAETDRAEFARRMTEICMGPEPYIPPDRRRCAWCEIRLPWYRRPFRYCRDLCAPRMQDSGIYLSAGGPPCPKGARRND